MQVCAGVRGKVVVQVCVICKRTGHVRAWESQACFDMSFCAGEVGLGFEVLGLKVLGIRLWNLGRVCLGFV